ncbi:hypothetical protein [Carboxylicivirga sp. RSCT41]|uniref:hypothetical protein n=1 Tax=Carboxylicivirga agarovorans TaxID=3417570 RepID=UPI003D32F376
MNIEQKRIQSKINDYKITLTEIEQQIKKKENRKRIIKDEIEELEAELSFRKRNDV